MREFLEAAQRTFHFLVDDYGFHLKEAEEITDTLDSLSYENLVIEVIISRGDLGDGIEIFFKRLDQPNISQSNWTLYGLNGFLRARGVRPVVGPARPIDFVAALQPLAFALREHVDDLLRGNMNAFDEIRSPDI